LAVDHGATACEQPEEVAHAGWRDAVGLGAGRDLVDCVPAVEPREEGQGGRVDVVEHDGARRVDAELQGGLVAPEPAEGGK
jgi:hypothetical protein